MEIGSTDVFPTLTSEIFVRNFPFVSGLSGNRGEVEKEGERKDGKEANTILRGKRVKIPE